MVNIRVLPPTQEDIRYCIEYARDEFGRKCVLRWKKELEAIYARLIMYNFKLIYRYDKERDEIVIVDIWYTKRSQQALLRQFKRKL